MASTLDVCISLYACLQHERRNISQMDLLDPLSCGDVHGLLMTSADLIVPCRCSNALDCSVLMWGLSVLPMTTQSPLHACALPQQSQPDASQQFVILLLTPATNGPRRLEGVCGTLQVNQAA